MRNLKILMILMAVALICTAVWAGDEKPWFDLKTCAFCKNFDLGNDNYLPDHMKAHYHTMSNGILAIMTVEEEYKDEFAKAGEGMEKVAKEMAETGKMPQMCGHCTAYGELLMSGAVEQQFNSDVAMAFMMTSDNPDVVTKLHAFAEKNNTEMAKWDAERTKAKEAKTAK